MTKKTEDKTEDLPLEVRQAKLKAELEASRRQRVTECQAELQQVLNKHNCQLDVSVVLRQNSVEPQLQILAKD